MLENYDVAYYAGSIEHLLPEKSYKELKDTHWNQLLACRACNGFKLDWDPNSPLIYALGDQEITEEGRSELIRRATAYIKDKRIAREKLFAEERKLILNSMNRGLTAMA